MKFNTAVLAASLAVILSVSALPANPEEPVAENALLGGRRECCKYSTGQWCGPQGCCLWRECTRYGGPAQCGYSGCCMKYNC
ncbi:hypothetical protein BGW38_001905 [Lunasporangiospora selenospora]|uniref:Uncharacterized protein n=1 Tax=Lunasporangiospora selenospora TaxID=979761 RepID=A0A9P6FST3_9FUNG|nr:hypothetical protein BGW38_001905 [Lunasporangiospora selenospora]